MANTTNNEAASTSEDKNPNEATINEESDVDDTDKSDDLVKQRQIELEEERKLKARHPCIQRPGSEFLQKRLQRGQKYFDSGDYNMAKATSTNATKLPDGTAPISAMDSKILNKRH